ncbi:MAG: hypothetical protein ACLU48_09220 [Clostridiaceae bacterium]
MPEEILLSIQQPARYIGGEVNMVKKDPSTVDIRFAMCFPDVYDIGMSHLGIQILYDMFNQQEDVYVRACLLSVDGSGRDHEGETDSAICPGIPGSGEGF